MARDTFKAKGENNNPNPEESEEAAEWYAVTRWHWEDVKEHQPTWSPEKCKRFLQEKERAIKNRLIELGNEVISDISDDY